MTKKLILVELPEKEHPKEQGMSWNDFLDTIESKSVKVDVGKLAELIFPSGGGCNIPYDLGKHLCDKTNAKKLANKIIQALESGELCEEKK